VNKTRQSSKARRSEAQKIRWIFPPIDHGV
jgi:hypothetical protein